MKVKVSSGLTAKSKFSIKRVKAKVPGSETLYVTGTDMTQVSSTVTAKLQATADGDGEAAVETEHCEEQCDEAIS